jgi:hypothetical protein
MNESGNAMTCPPEILEWLAWYADDALPDAQRGAVEAHAAECAECRAELAMLAGAGAPLLDAPHADQVFEKVLARIEAAGVGGGAVEVGGHRTASQARHAPLRAPLRASRERRIGRIAAAAALLVAVASAGWLARDLAGVDAIYRTASGPAATAPAGATSSAQLDVVFRADASVDRINTNLRALGAVVVSGPSQAGRYRLALPAGSDAAAAAAMLRAEDTGVASFAEPVLP